MTNNHYRSSRSHVVAKVNALDRAVKDAGFQSRSAFASYLRNFAGAPRRATTLNLWHRYVIDIAMAEVVTKALKASLGDLFELSNGRQIK